MKNFNLCFDTVELNPCTIFGSTTRGVDRYEPDVEIISLAKKTYSQMSMPVWKNENVSVTNPEDKSLKSKLKLKLKKSISHTETPIFDLRFNNPGNWAHSIFYHIPLACELNRIYNDNILYILPNLANKEVYALYKLLDLNFIVTDGIVEGQFIEIDKERIELLSLSRRFWMEPHLEKIHVAVDTHSSAIQFPEKIFVNRRDSRKIKNPEISQYLLSEGYAEIFVEDYSCVDQLSLIDKAKCIVGIHGAGLAPILYNRNPDFEKTLVGVMPFLQVTSGFRLLCNQSKVKWVGVRGELDPSEAGYVYDHNVPPVGTSYSDFFVCQKSLEMALSHFK